MEKLDSPYKMIAADVNQDGFINALDLLEVRQLVLREIDVLANSESWRFVLADFSFTSDEPQSESFPERTTISLDEMEMRQDFIGIKMADLDLNSDPKLRRRSADALSLMTDDAILEAGESRSVYFQVPNAVGLLGYQFTLEVDPAMIDVVAIEEESHLEIDRSNFGLSGLEEGMITTSWGTNNPLDLKQSQIFGIRILAKRRVQLSKAIAVNGKVTPAASYTESGTKPVVLEFGNSIIENQLILDQNEPNPVTDQTVIGFNLPHAGDATLNFYDVTGRLIYNITGEYQKGRHRINIDAKNLGSSGMIYYELEMGEERLSRKMIIH